MFTTSTYFKLYSHYILKRPIIVVSILFTLFCYFGYQIQYFKLDASADSLVLEHDADLKYSRTIRDRYKENDYLFMTYTPKEDLFSQNTIKDLKKLKKEILTVNGVDSVLTILDVPLLQSPPIPLKDIKTHQITLLSKDVDINLAKKEIKNSPIFKELLVSKDLRSTAIKIDLKTDSIFEGLLKTRTKLIDKKYDKTITPEELLKLRKVSKEYKQLAAKITKQRHNQIIAVRTIMKGHRSNAKVFLGGVSMVSDDMMTYIKNDLKIFGIGMFLFLCVTLGILFKKIRWVLIPLLCCIFSVVFMMGMLGIFSWQVTVISSNFISLQLIITMSLTIHLIVRFNELSLSMPDATINALVEETVKTIFKPCMYTSITTIAGFGSLILCDILPVVNFGLMMTMGIITSLIITFLLFPTTLLLIHPAKNNTEPSFGFSLTYYFAKFTQKYGTIIFTVSIVITLLTCYGISQLEVENSFIDYFKKTTEIYQGMKIIDQELGGTTSLDVTINFSEKNNDVQQEANIKHSNADEDFENFEDFEEEQESNEKYWYTNDKLELIEKIHKYLESLNATGKVLSLNTMLQIVYQLNGNKKLDNFDLALIFKEIPQEFKDIIINPYSSVEHNQARISLRIKDSLKNLRRNEFLQKIESDLIRMGVKKENFKLSGLMVLYNNMLQSLFKSQIETIGFTVLALMIMFMILFKSFKISLIAIFPNLISSLVVLGVMGLKGIPLDMMTITIVAISIGIAVDNTIHYIHRFRHEFEINPNYMETMFCCHGSIGNAMYYTSLTIIIGFSILSLSNFIPSVLFGILTGVAMFMALLAALTLLPRLIILFQPFGKEK